MMLACRSKIHPLYCTISVCSLPKEMNLLSDHRKRSDNHNKGGEMPMYTCMLVMQTKINMITDKDIGHGDKLSKLQRRRKH